MTQPSERKWTGEEPTLRSIACEAARKNETIDRIILHGCAAILRHEAEACLQRGIVDPALAYKLKKIAQRCDKEARC